MKPGLKLAGLLLILVLAPRMATADAFLLQRVGPVLAAGPSAASPGSPAAVKSVLGQGPVTGCQDRGNHLVEMPKRRWGVPRRWKLAKRAGGGEQREATPAVPGPAGSLADRALDTRAGGTEARGQPRNRSVVPAFGLASQRRHGTE